MPFLNFKGKAAVETYHHALPHHTLEFAPDLSVLDEGREPSLDDNLIIEGDNLIALKALLPTHAGRIRCAYLDPPYNTGNEHWIYSDNLTQPQFVEWIGKEVGKDADDACRHDKWCCMMYPRLQLLRELLSDDGAIFISIDDNEVHHLRLMMDEIFGDSNFVGSIAWQKKYSVSPDDRGIGSMHEHLLVYGKTSDFSRGLLPRSDAQDDRYDNPDDDPRGVWASGEYLSSKTKVQRPNSWFQIRHPKTGEMIWPPEDRVWRTNPKRHLKIEEEGRLHWGPTMDYRYPRLKRYLGEVQPGLVPPSWWPHTETGHNDEAKKEIQRILGGDARFDTPKPVRLIKRVIQVALGDEDGIVLDSFAGSGTTAQAVLELNKEDGGDRRFILVQQPYETRKQQEDGFSVCQEVTARRVRRVVEGYSFQGNRTETLLETKVGLKELKKADSLLKNAAIVKAQNEARFDQVKSEMKDGTLRVIGTNNITEVLPGLGGSFAYFRVSPEPLFGEFRNLGEKLPEYDDLARYVFFTETSRQWSSSDANRATGKIGEWDNTSYYLLYKPNNAEDWGLDVTFLRTVAEEDPNKHLVVYCEMFWMHRDDLRRWQKEAGKTVRSMLVPFNLK